MNRLTEDGLEINFTNAKHVMKFDQQEKTHPEFHDIDQMPRVDFVIEMENDIFFIELKDPGRPNPADEGNTKLLRKIVSGSLEASLVEKYLFTFFFRWAEDKIHKSVHFICLITLESPLLLTISEDLERHMRLLSATSVRWGRKPLASCQVHNIETWAEVFPNWPVTRLPQQ